MPIICRKLSKQLGDPPQNILTDISLVVNDGEFVSLTGRSGSGKSTLLYLLSTLDLECTGELEIDGYLVQNLSLRDIHRFRNERMGFVFQFHHLIPELSVIENVLMPSLKNGKSMGLRQVSAKFARELLNRFGLYDKLDRLPRQLSGGEQQRTAIVRALVMSPKYIFADEPTGNLDSANGEIVMKVFQDINKDMGTTIIYVTHDREFASIARRQIRLKDGCLESS